MDKSRIVVVEDDPQLAILVRLMLAPAGYEVTVCDDLFQVFLALESAALVLCDLHLRHMAGRDMVKAIRDSGSKVPVLMMSGDNSLTAVRKCIAAGADGFIGKPFNQKQLAERVNTMLDSQRATSEPQTSL
jgi:two-component system response regulator CpxR